MGRISVSHPSSEHQNWIPVSWLLFTGSLLISVKPGWPLGLEPRESVSGCGLAPRVEPVLLLVQLNVKPIIPAFVLYPMPPTPWDSSGGG